MKLIRMLLSIFAVLLTILSLCYLIPIISAELRMRAKNQIAGELVEEVRREFPGAQYHAGGSSTLDAIYVTILKDHEKVDTEKLKLWLRAKRQEKQIREQILLVYQMKEKWDYISVDD